MSKTLVIVAHPNLGQSTINRRWVAELQKHPGRVTVHSLYEHYPQGRAIDIAAEQRLVDAHARLVLQFPVYWFNCPPLLKQWLDEVFTHGWAYGSKGKSLQSKPLACAVSLGSPAEHYSPTGHLGHTIEQMLLPFELTAIYVGARYQKPFSFSGINSESAWDEATLKRVDASAADYLKWLAWLEAKK